VAQSLYWVLPPPTHVETLRAAQANKPVQFGYGFNYLIDIENASDLDVEATLARTYDEVAATKPAGIY